MSKKDIYVVNDKDSRFGNIFTIRATREEAEADVKASEKPEDKFITTARVIQCDEFDQILKSDEQMKVAYNENRPLYLAIRAYDNCKYRLLPELVLDSGMFGNGVLDLSILELCDTIGVLQSYFGRIFVSPECGNALELLYKVQEIGSKLGKVEMIQFPHIPNWKNLFAMEINNISISNCRGAPLRRGTTESLAGPAVWKFLKGINHGKPLF